MPIAEEHWQYLGVHFEDKEGNLTFWVWTVLVLGLRDAAHIFTRVTPGGSFVMWIFYSQIIAPIMAQLRREGARSLIYIGKSSFSF